MSGRSKEFTRHVKDEAIRIVSSSGVNLLEENVPVLALAKRLMESTGCGIDTAKVRIVKAARQLRHIAQHGEPPENEAKQGGARPGSGFPAGMKREGRRGKAKVEKENQLCTN